VTVVLAAIIGFLIGGIPTGILISRAISGVDPRGVGSGSSGATNVSRVIGKKWAIVVLLLDALKGYLPVKLLAPVLAGNEGLILIEVVLALSAVAGHIWTPYAKFRGGKGVATSAGVILALDASALIIALAIWLILFLVFRRVSVASLSAAFTVPVAMTVMGGRPPLVVAAASVLALLLLFTHRDNIRRMMSGNEQRFA
jgi:glycerol-3-phosphate acyltransferase PlsY